MNTPEHQQPGVPSGDTTIHYSTPFGDAEDGQQKPFMLGRDDIPFHPVFYTRDSTIEFLERMNRAGYLIIEGTIASVQDTVRWPEPLKNAGIVIEPLSEHPIELPPDA